MRQDIEEKQRAVEEQEHALEKSREEEIRKLQIQSQREEWEIMNRKRILQKELDINVLRLKVILLTKFPKEASLFLVGVNTKLLQNFSWNQVQVNWKLLTQANLKLFF